MNEELAKALLNIEGVDETLQQSIISSINPVIEAGLIAKGKKVTGEFLGHIDNVLSTKLNVTKKENEKTTDAILRGFNENNEALKGGYEKEIEELKTKLTKKSDADPELLNNYNLLKTTLETEREAWTQKENEITDKYKQESTVNSLMIHIPDNIKENSLTLKAIKEDIAKIASDKVVFEKDGKSFIKGDETNAFQNVEIIQYLKGVNPDIFTLADKISGGTENVITGSGNNNAKSDVSLSSATTKAEFVTKLKEKVMAEGNFSNTLDSRYVEAYKKGMEENKALYNNLK